MSEVEEAVNVLEAEAIGLSKGPPQCRVEPAHSGSHHTVWGTPADLAFPPGRGHEGALWAAWIPGLPWGATLAPGP